MIQTVGKVAEILDLFSAEEPEWGARAAGRRLQIPKSTAHALMDSMAEQRLLHRTDRGRYELGWRLFELGQTLLDTTQIRTAARAVMQDLVNRLGETVHLATLDGVQAVYIEKLPRVATDQGLAAARKGARRPAHASAVGKVLLAHRDWEDIRPLLERDGLQPATPNTITSAGELAEKLEEVRDSGWACDLEESCLGLCCVAAPVYNNQNKTIAALSLAVPTARFKAREREYLGTVLEAARRISKSADRKPDPYSADSVGRQLQGV